MANEVPTPIAGEARPYSAPRAPQPASAPPAQASQMTPASAWAELDRLKDDASFVEAFASGKETAKLRFNELTDLTKGQPRPAPAPVPTPDWHEVGEFTVAQMTPEQRAKHDSMFGAPTDPSAYKLDLGGFGDGDPDAIARSDSDFRGWLVAGKVPVEVGNQLAEYLRADAEKFASMDDDARLAHGGETANKLRNVWGQNADVNLNLVKRLIADVEKVRPGLGDWLNRTGLGNSFALATSLYEVAQRRYGTATAAPGGTAARLATTAENAQAQINNLLGDRAFRERFINNEPTAKALVDLLQRQKLGMA